MNLTPTSLLGGPQRSSLAASRTNEDPNDSQYALLQEIRPIHPIASLYTLYSYSHISTENLCWRSESFSLRYQLGAATLTNGSGRMLQKSFCRSQIHNIVLDSWPCCIQADCPSKIFRAFATRWGCRF